MWLDTLLIVLAEQYNSGELLLPGSDCRWTRWTTTDMRPKWYFDLGARCHAIWNRCDLPVSS